MNSWVDRHVVAFVFASPHTIPGRLAAVDFIVVVVVIVEIAVLVVHKPQHVVGASISLFPYHVVNGFEHWKLNVLS